MKGGDGGGGNKIGGNEHVVATSPHGADDRLRLGRRRSDLTLASGGECGAEITALPPVPTRGKMGLRKVLSSIGLRKGHGVEVR